MRLAASNIAWARGDDESAAAIMRELRFEGVELAPTAVWDSPLEQSSSELARYRGWWERQGLPIVSLQALLFGRSDLRIFGDAHVRERTFEYLAAMIRLGSALGARILVFGSPKNRKVGALSPSEADAIAVPFFGRLGDLAYEHGTSLCIEPNPPQYDCDFVTCARDGVELVTRVASPGFGLHLDAGAITLSGDQIDPSLERAMAVARHFHISEPQLAPIGSGGVDHAAVAAALRSVRYGQWLSVEMRAAAPPHTRVDLERSLKAAAEAYAGVFDP